MVNVVTARNETNNSTWRTSSAPQGRHRPQLVMGRVLTRTAKTRTTSTCTTTSSAPSSSYALDAVKTPAAIVCGVTIPGRINPQTGVPLQPPPTSRRPPQAAHACRSTCSAPATPTRRRIDYAFRTLEEFSTYKQDVAAANLRGDLFDGFGAGPVKLATGVEWRREHGNVTHNLANQPWYTDYFLSYGLDYGGTTEVLEGYGELNVPVFQDSPVGKYLELDRGDPRHSQQGHGHAAASTPA